MDKTALLIIDTQKGFINEHTQALLSKIEALIERDDYCFIAASRFINPKGSGFEKWMGWTRFRANNIEDTALAFTPPEHAYVYDKYGYNALTPELLKHFKGHCITRVHLCGMDTNMCVFTTAAALFEQGLYEPYILSAYCASHSGPAYHDAGLMLLEKTVGKEHLL